MFPDLRIWPLFCHTEKCGVGSRGPRQNQTSKLRKKQGWNNNRKKPNKHPNCFSTTHPRLDCTLGSVLSGNYEDREIKTHSRQWKHKENDSSEKHLHSSQVLKLFHRGTIMNSKQTTTFRGERVKNSRIKSFSALAALYWLTDKKIWVLRDLVKRKIYKITIIQVCNQAEMTNW